jgi:hypothetical protein
VRRGVLEIPKELFVGEITNEVRIHDPVVASQFLRRGDAS